MKEVAGAPQEGGLLCKDRGEPLLGLLAGQDGKNGVVNAGRLSTACMCTGQFQAPYAKIQSC